MNVQADYARWVKIIMLLSLPMFKASLEHLCGEEDLEDFIWFILFLLELQVKNDNFRNVFD